MEEAAVRAVEMVEEEAAMEGAREEVKTEARLAAAGDNPGDAADAATELRGTRASGRAPSLSSETRRRSGATRT